MKNETIVIEVLSEQNIEFDIEHNSFNTCLIINFESLEKCLTLLKERLGFILLLDIHGTSYNEELTLIYHLLNLEDHYRIRIKTSFQKEHKVLSVKELWSNAAWKERELKNSLGIEIGYDCEPLFVNAEKKTTSLRRSVHSEDYSNPLVKVDIDDISNLGRSKFFFEIDGMQVSRPELLLGYEQRNIEKSLVGINILDISQKLEKINIPVADFYSSLYCNIFEEILQIDLPERAIALRMIMHELFRIKDHLNCLSNQMKFCSGSSLYDELKSYRALVIQLINRITGHPHFSYLSQIGGVTKDIPIDWRYDCLEGLRSLGKSLTGLVKTLGQNMILRERLSYDNVLPLSAISLGVTGPALRATGINVDLRKSNPYYFYNQVEFEVPLGLNGSSYDRFLVRYEEILQSSNIIFQLLDNFPLGNLYSVSFQSIYELNEYIRNTDIDFGAKEIYRSIESPNGELGFYIKFNDNLNISEFKTIAPSYNLGQLFERQSSGFYVEDIKLLISAYNIHFQEIER